MDQFFFNPILNANQMTITQYWQVMLKAGFFGIETLTQNKQRIGNGFP